MHLEAMQNPRAANAGQIVSQSQSQSQSPFRVYGLVDGQYPRRYPFLLYIRPRLQMQTASSVLIASDDQWWQVGSITSAQTGFTFR